MTILFLILYNIVRRRQHRRWASVGHCGCSSISETLLVLWYRLSTYLPARLCTISIFCIALWVCGSHTLAEYSRRGRTSPLYAFVLMLCDLVLMFLFTKPSIWFALPAVWLICLFQFRSEVIVTPKYFVLFTLFKIRSSYPYVKVIMEVNGSPSFRKRGCP